MGKIGHTCSKCGTFNWLVGVGGESCKDCHHVLTNDPPERDCVPTLLDLYPEPEPPEEY